MLLKRITLLVYICICVIIGPALAQKNAQAYSGSRSSSNTSIFTSKEDKSPKKRNKIKRSKKGYSAKAGIFGKKKDCDCPGSPKAQRKKRRR